MGVTDLGPETVDPDARSPAGVAEPFCGPCVLSQVQAPLSRLVGVPTVHESQPCRGRAPALASDVGSDLPPPFPGSFPSHRRRPFLTEEDAYFCGTPFPRRVGWCELCTPTSCDSSRHWLVGWDYVIDPAPAGPQTQGRLELGARLSNAQ